MERVESLTFLSDFQVLFRYAIAVFKYMENTLLKQGDYMSIYNTLRDGLEYLSDIQTLTQVSFDIILYINKIILLFTKSSHVFQNCAHSSII